MAATPGVMYAVPFPRGSPLRYLPRRAPVDRWSGPGSIASPGRRPSRSPVLDRSHALAQGPACARGIQARIARRRSVLPGGRHNIFREHHQIGTLALRLRHEGFHARQVLQRIHESYAHLHQRMISSMFYKGSPWASQGNCCRQGWPCTFENGECRTRLGRRRLPTKKTHLLLRHRRASGTGKSPFEHGMNMTHYHMRATTRG